MPEPYVVTVTGRLPARELGVIDAHDHLLIASPALKGGEIEDPERVAEEVREGRATGIGAIVELTPIGLGRRPDLMRRVAEETGVAVIAATGYHRDAHYPAGHWVCDAPTSLLAERIVADLARGMHPADWEGEAAPDAARAGVIKAGTSYQRISPAERRRLEAAAIGSMSGGVAIVVHTEIGTCGNEIVDILEAAGATPDRIVLAHLDRNPDLELHAEIVARGVTLVYDTIGRIKYRPDSVLLDLVEGMVAAGHGTSILLGLDLGTRDYFRSFGGGPGMRELMTGFVPRLRRRIGDEATDAILVANPARVYAVAEARG
ncbi:MAG: phosphotriesterase family protein [Candidatus Limnocylindrales bacterium]